MRYTMICKNDSTLKLVDVYSDDDIRFGLTSRDRLSGSYTIRTKAVFNHSLTPLALQTNIFASYVIYPVLQVDSYEKTGNREYTINVYGPVQMLEDNYTNTVYSKSVDYNLNGRDFQFSTFPHFNWMGDSAVNNFYYEDDGKPIKRVLDQYYNGVPNEYNMGLWWTGSGNMSDYWAGYGGYNFDIPAQSLLSYTQYSINIYGERYEIEYKGGETDKTSLFYFSDQFKSVYADNVGLAVNTGINKRSLESTGDYDGMSQAQIAQRLTTEMAQMRGFDNNNFFIHAYTSIGKVINDLTKNSQGRLLGCNANLFGCGITNVVNKRWYITDIFFTKNEVEFVLDRRNK